MIKGNNMREIEFRAWNKEKKIMCFDNEDDSASYWDGVYSSDIGLMNHSLKRMRKEYVIMQYTGIDDEDGTKIFDGDIVEVYARRYVDYSPKSKYDVPTKIRGVVKFKTSWNCIGYSIDYDNSYNEKLREPKGKEQCKRYFEQRPLCCFDFNVHKKQDHPNWVWKNHIKVIGNVFENPELLGEKDDIKE